MVQTRAKTWKELDSDLVANAGVITVTGEKLRAIHGADRIGSNVRAAIIRELEARDIAIDSSMKFYGESLVRLYKRGTPAAEIIDAVHYIGHERDEIIRRWISGASGKLAQIREILDAE